MIRPQVIYEDNHLLVVNKPAGWLVQGDNTGDFTLTDWVREYIKEKFSKPGDVFAHPTHRIDRPVSGLVVFARTSKALERMNELFRKDLIEKKYVALVIHRPSVQSDTLTHYLVKNESTNTVSVFNGPRTFAKESILNYKYLSSFGEYFLVGVSPKTGRPHQIRAQLAAIGCPIAGDVKYGAGAPLKDKSIRLHAYSLSFVHPVKKEPQKLLSFPNWLPNDFTLHEL